MAKKFTDTPVKIAGYGQASDTLALHDRRDITTMDATVLAAKRALHGAKLVTKDVDLAEVHDNFTITEIISIEDLGFFEKGNGGPASEEGRTALNAEISVNKARGQPVGATGLAQVVEVFRQLQGDCGDRQVDGAEVGLTHSLGGTGASSIVHIFRRAD
jgi:acetyl-CoA C-acetyltransferase